LVWHFGVFVSTFIASGISLSVYGQTAPGKKQHSAPNVLEPVKIRDVVGQGQVFIVIKRDNNIKLAMVNVALTGCMPKPAEISDPDSYCHFLHPSQDIVHVTCYVTRLWSILTLFFGVTPTTVYMTSVFNHR
jgi:hypothetical protein